MPKKKAAKTKKTVATIVHEDASRKNIPTAEYESVMEKEDQSPIEVAYKRRNRDLDPQLVWRGKDEQDWSDLVVQAPPLYIQEKVHPKALIDDLLRRTEESEPDFDPQMDMFGDFNGLPSEDAKTEFYQHDANWTNRMILGDSLQVMASLAEREGLKGRVQCIYFDPPYGIKFNSNFQWSTTSRDVKDGKQEHITREPEMVKAFRDTWRNGIHTYLTYLRDRLTVARDLLSDSGSLFLQIGDDNVHRVRALLDEVFGDQNCISVITLKKTAGQDERLLNNVSDYILWYAKSKSSIKYRDIFNVRRPHAQDLGQYGKIELPDLSRRPIQPEDYDSSGMLRTEGKPFQQVIATSSGHGGNTSFPVSFQGKDYLPTANRHWSTHPEGFKRLVLANRIVPSKTSLRYIRLFEDFVAQSSNNIWTDLGSATNKTYVVETAPSVVQRCILMATDPGDLVLDPTCGSGTSAFVSENWGRRWITIDTSRVSLALARARIMGAKYPFYLLADSEEGRKKEAALSRTSPSETPAHGNIRHGFVYGRVPHITLKSIANNTEIDVIWETFQEQLDNAREKLNGSIGKQWQDWEIPREPHSSWTEKAKNLHLEWWNLRIAYQNEIDSSIAAKADQEYLYDKPYEDKKKVRVAGPFTVESLSPHRILGVDENDELINPLTSDAGDSGYNEAKDFATAILENLKTAGVQQSHKEGKIDFTSLDAWPGHFVCAEGVYTEGESDTGKRAAIFIGPEFGTVSRADLVAAAREAGDGGFDVLIACAFNYEARTTDFDKLGRLPILKARMNADLHMADELKNTGSGNLFVIFGEPDIDLTDSGDGKLQVKVNGVDVFKPQLGKVESSNTDEIACWFIDTDYNEESFFVRHAYFLGASDPYKSLQKTLKAEINVEAWESLYSDTSRPFRKPSTGRIAVKVINHLGDEVMKVFRV